jgi:predicted dehydrogenase
MSQDVYKRRLRAGIVGGGAGAFIGAVHRIACELDSQAMVVAGAMSSDPKRAKESADAWYLDRSYDSYVDMALAESTHPEGIDFVIIATPNNLHFPVAKAFLEAGIHVVCDKPMTFDLKEAEELVAIVKKSGLIFALTHPYLGYPAVQQAKAMVANGELGVIRKVQVEYNQDWLLEPVAKTSLKQAEWRTDPARAGVSCCVGDIGTHGENLLEHITGLKIESLCADLTSFAPGRALDDDANMLLRLEKGAKGYLTCSQIACGEENNLNIRVYGTKAAIEWHQQNPNYLTIKPHGKPWETWGRGSAYMGDAAKALTRTPHGHPEGYLEAFATLYKLIIADLRRVKSGQAAQGGYPTAEDGLRGMKFVAKAVESSKLGAVWVKVA